MCVAASRCASFADAAATAARNQPPPSESSHTAAARRTHCERMVYVLVLNRYLFVDVCIDPHTAAARRRTHSTVVNCGISSAGRLVSVMFCATKIVRAIVTSSSADDVERSRRRRSRSTPQRIVDAAACGERRRHPPGRGTENRTTTARRVCAYGESALARAASGARVRVAGRGSRSGRPRISARALSAMSSIHRGALARARSGISHGVSRGTAARPRRRSNNRFASIRCDRDPPRDPTLDRPSDSNDLGTASLPT